MAIFHAAACDVPSVMKDGLGLISRSVEGLRGLRDAQSNDSERNPSAAASPFASRWPEFLSCTLSFIFSRTCESRCTVELVLLF